MTSLLGMVASSPRNVARDGPGPPPDASVAIAIPLVVLSLALVILVAVLLAARQRRRLEALLQTGVPGRARVVQVAVGGTQLILAGQRYREVDVGVEVEGPAPYRARFTRLFAEPHLPSIQPGALVDLRVDPDSPTRVAFVGVVPEHA